MNWEEIIQEKLISEEEAASLIKSHDRVFVAPSATMPYGVLNHLSARYKELEDVKLASCMVLAPVDFLKNPDSKGHIDYYTFFYSGFDKVGVQNGNTHINSIHFSKVCQHMRDDFKPNVLLTEVSEPDEEGYVTWGAVGVAFTGETAELDSIEKKIFVINKYQPKNMVGRKVKVHLSEADHICRNDHPIVQLPQPEVTPLDEQVAALILPYIPDGAVLQLGLGGLANAIGYGLKDKKNLGVRTEMLTDSMVALAKEGVISEDIFAAFGIGSTAVYDFLDTGRVRLAPISEVNDPYEVGKCDNFISINSCLMADLTGQVCSESLGFKQFSGTGGQLDFVKGAARSKGGKSFLCMLSTTKDKSGKLISKINCALPPGAVVTTPRSEVMYIVTEYGVADLYLKPIEERVEAMIAIAHPDFRDSLRQEAVAAGLIPG